MENTVNSLFTASNKKKSKHSVKRDLFFLFVKRNFGVNSSQCKRIYRTIESERMMTYGGN